MAKKKPVKVKMAKKRAPEKKIRKQTDSRAALMKTSVTAGESIL